MTQTVIYNDMTLNFFKVVLMQLKHIVAQCKVEHLEQYVLNKLHFTLTELLENFLNSRLAMAYIFSFAFLGKLCFVVIITLILE